MAPDLVALAMGFNLLESLQDASQESKGVLPPRLCVSRASGTRELPWSLTAVLSGELSRPCTVFPLTHQEGKGRAGEAAAQWGGCLLSVRAARIESTRQALESPGRRAFGELRENVSRLDSLNTNTKRAKKQQPSSLHVRKQLPGALATVPPLP